MLPWPKSKYIEMNSNQLAKDDDVGWCEALDVFTMLKALRSSIYVIGMTENVQIINRHSDQ